MRLLCNLTLLLCSIAIFAEQPNWYSDSQRAINFPQGQYFTGIAYGELRSNESVGSALERMKAMARAEASSTIIVHVQSETNSHLHDETYESVESWTEEIKETFDSHVNIKVDLENLPGLQVEAWKNPSNNEVVAFAYVKKNTLCRQMDKQITVGLTRIEAIIENTEQLIANSQKLQARESIYKATPLFKEVEQAQRILIAIDPSSDAESLQLEETKRLSQRYIVLTAQLKNSINIYLDFSADIFGKSYCPIKEQIIRDLSKNGCTFVNDNTNADWILKLNVYAEQDEGRSNADEDFITIDVSGNIFNVNKQSGHEIYETDRESAFKANGGYKLAVEKILKRGNLANAITNDIMEIFKN